MSQPMSDKLAEIIATKHQEVEALMPRADLLRAAALQRNDFGGFRAALDRGPNRLGMIAEVKKASPSAGIIDPDFDPVRQAKRYIEGGASCLSILTDEQYFQGSLSYLTQISKFSDAPLLRKDFTIHEVQIHEASVSGADAILLIVAALDDEQLKRLYEEAKGIMLDVLVEVHNIEEMDRALELSETLSFVLGTSETSRTTSPASRNALAVPPVERSSTPCPASVFARSTSPDLSETESNARLSGIRSVMGGMSLSTRRFLRAQSPEQRTACYPFWTATIQCAWCIAWHGPKAQSALSRAG